MDSHGTDSEAKAAKSARWEELLETIVSLTQSSGGAIWKVQQGQAGDLLCQHGLGGERLDRAQRDWPGHSDQLAEVARLRETRSLTARFEQDSPDAPAQTLRLVLVPLQSNGRGEAIIELFFAAERTVDPQQVEQTIRALLNWNRLVATDSAQTPDSRNFAGWLRAVHAHLTPEECCSALANETRVWSGWDRVSVAVRQGSRLRTASISGPESFDRRAAAVQEMDQLFGSFRRDPRPARYPETAAADGLETRAAAEQDSPSLAPAQFLNDYSRRVSAHAAAIFPLWESDSPDQTLIGALLFENFQESGRGRPVGELELLAQQASVALTHAVRYDRARTVAPLRWIRESALGTLARWAVSLISLAALLAFLSLWPARLVVTGSGVLVPEQQRDVFAGSEAIVESILVRHGDTVSQAQPLIRLRSPELEFEMHRLRGELQTVEQQIRDLETLITDPGRGNDTRNVKEFAVRSEELKVTRRNLEQQLELLGQRSAALTLVSPMEGQILTWDLEELLAGRPVQRTDRLLSVARLDGPWTLHLNVEDRDTGPVVRAIRNEQVTVTFVTADAPERSQTATVRELAPALMTDSQRGTYLILTADVTEPPAAETRPGTNVLYRIDCGQAPIGYVWFRRFLDRVGAWWSLLCLNQAGLTVSGSGL